MRRALLLCLVVSCGGKPQPAAPDAAPLAAAEPDGSPEGDSSSTTTSRQPPPAVQRMRLTLTLRSTPPGAAAAVDGRPIGQTPVVHIIDSDGRPHEFTFVLPGYAPWRVRFPPVRDGVIHATLTQIIFADGGP